jgi:hypothetical protein
VFGETVEGGKIPVVSEPVHSVRILSKGSDISSGSVVHHESVRNKIHKFSSFHGKGSTF